MYFPIIFSVIAILFPFILRPDFISQPIIVAVSLGLMLFLFLKIYTRLKSEDADDLNVALRMTALLNLLYCLCFASINLLS